MLLATENVALSGLSFQIIFFKINTSEPQNNLQYSQSHAGVLSHPALSLGTYDAAKV